MGKGIVPVGFLDKEWEAIPSNFFHLYNKEEGRLIHKHAEMTMEQFKEHYESKGFVITTKSGDTAPVAEIERRMEQLKRNSVQAVKMAKAAAKRQAAIDAKQPGLTATQQRAVDAQIKVGIEAAMKSREPTQPASEKAKEK